MREYTITKTFKVKGEDKTDAEWNLKYSLDHSPLICENNGIDIVTGKWAVHDNVTDTVVRTFEDEDGAIRLCGGLNHQAGPGGRYSVKPT